MPKVQEVKTKTTYALINEGGYKTSYSCYPDSSTEVRLTPYLATRYQESITNRHGRALVNGKVKYQATPCIHSKSYNEVITGSYSGSLPLKVEKFVDGKWEWVDCTFSFEGSRSMLIYPVATPVVDSLRIERLIAQGMKSISQGGSSPKKPNSEDIGETMGEGCKMAMELVNNMLNRRPPIPRSPSRPSRGDPWKDTWHPLENMFGINPTIDQAAALADAKAFIKDPYFERLVKWQHSLRRTYNSYGSRTRLVVFDGTKTENYPLVGNGGGIGAFHKMNKTKQKTYITGRLYARDTTEVEFWDQSSFLFKSLLHTGWDMVNFSYMIGRFVPQIEMLLDGGLAASQSMGMRRNEAHFSFTTAQVHTLITMESVYLPIWDSKAAGPETTCKGVNYTRSENDGLSGEARENVINVADVISDFFDDGIPSIGDWNPMQYLDTLMLFVPTINIR